MARLLGTLVGALLVGLLVAALVGAEDTDQLVAKGKQLFFDRGCYGCHTVGVVGTPIAPDLARVGAKYSQTYLAAWIRNPSAVRDTAHMPDLKLADADVEALAAYLATLK